MARGFSAIGTQIRSSLLWVLAPSALAVLLAYGWQAAPEAVEAELFHQQSEAIADEFILQLVDHLDHGAATFNNGQVTPDDVIRLQAVAGTGGIYRLILRDAKGTALWSTDPADIGKTETTSDLAASLNTGENAFFHLHLATDATGPDQPPLPEMEVSANWTLGDKWDVNYQILPVLDGGEAVGTIETITDVTELHAVWGSTILWSSGILAALIGSLGLAALLRIRHAGAETLASSKAHAKAESDYLSEQLRVGREVRLLGDLNEWLQSSKSLDELFYMVTRFMSHLLPDASGSIYVYSNSRDVLDGACSWNGGQHHPHIHPEDCWGLRRGRTYAFEDGEVKFACGHVHDEHPKDYICIPFLAHGETVGMMHLSAHHDASAEFLAQRKLAQMCAEQISLAIANVRMRDELHFQAIRDPLTGLHNRRHMMDTLRRRIETRKSAPFSIVSIDIDHFKNFNDNHGHDAGDVVLRAVGEVLSTACDGSEVACRMGGEELMLMLPDINHATALDRAEAVREAVAGLTVRYGDKNLPQITISVGVADYPGHGASPQDVIRSADEALYAAKAKGRNCVVSASDVEPGSLLPLARQEEDAIAAIAAE